MAAGSFRRDLYFRLANFVLPVPPLRERPEDIPILADHFLNMFAGEMGKPRVKLSAAVIEALHDYGFPGNVRELKSIMERAIIDSGGSEIRVEHLHLMNDRIPATEASTDSTGHTTSHALPLNLNVAQRELAERALAVSNGNLSRAAQLLGVNRTKLYRLLAQGGPQSGHP